jgi:hypothetical protein
MPAPFVLFSSGISAGGHLGSNPCERDSAQIRGTELSGTMDATFQNSEDLNQHGPINGAARLSEEGNLGQRHEKRDGADCDDQTSYDCGHCV